MTLLVADGAGGEVGAQPTAGLPPVEVSAMRDPVAKSYRRIVEGIELFERRRDLASAAPLRFRLLPRRTDTAMDSIALRIVGQTRAIDVPVAADHTFTLPLDRLALKEDAIVVPNRKAGSMTWRADIRTPGLPPGTRRLGDLRLECLVGMESGLISNHRPSWLAAFADRASGARRCDQREPRYLFFADGPLWSVTLVHGHRREVLPVGWLYAGVSRLPMTAEDLRHCDCEVLLDRTYFAPTGDPDWPDDTVLEFEYMESRGEGHALIGRSGRDVIDAFGPPVVIRFDSGYEVWVFRFREPAVRPRTEASRAASGSRHVRENDAPPSELVMLMSPSKIVSKVRVRIADGRGGSSDMSLVPSWKDNEATQNGDSR